MTQADIERIRQEIPEVPISKLPFGTHFLLLCDEPLSGTLLYANDCRALVRLDGVKHAEFTDRKTGRTVSFDKPAEAVNWSPNTPVIPLAEGVSA